MEYILNSVGPAESKRVTIQIPLNSEAFDFVCGYYNTPLLLTLSASGLAKFIIIKNGQTVATLFNNNNNLNILFYNTVNYTGYDLIEVIGINREYNVYQDLYIGWDLGDVL